MSELIRIGERYISLDQIADVNLEATVTREDYDTAKHTMRHIRTPAVVITLTTTRMTQNGDITSETIEYAQQEYDIVKPWLKDILDARCVRQIDLPKPKKYVFVAVPTKDTDPEGDDDI